MPPLLNLPAARRWPWTHAQQRPTARLTGPAWMTGNTWSACCLALASACTAHAQTTPTASAPVVGQSILHHVRAGDTLEHLAELYLGERQQWPALQAHNGGVHPLRLKPGSVLEIPTRLLRAATASVAHVQGSASLSRSTGSSSGVTRGQLLQEGDKLQLAPDAFVTVQLADGSTVQVQAASQLQLNQLRRRGRAGSLQSVLQLQQGGVDVQVPGKADARRQLHIVTPVAATSVRGTHFDVQLAEDGRSSTASVLHGAVAITTSSTSDTPILPPGMGIAVNAAGQASAPVALLPAPDAALLPQLAEDAQWLSLPLPEHPGTHAWRVAVSADAAGQQVLRGGLFDGPQARFAAVEDGSYHLQVRPVDAHGISGFPAHTVLRVKAHPVAPLLQSPAPGGLLPQGEAELQCTPVDGAAHYRVQLLALPAADTPVVAADFAQPTHDVQQLTTCQLPMPTLANGYYAWRTASVRTLADGSLDQGPYGPAQTFRVAPRPNTPEVQSHSTYGVTHLHWPGEPGQRFRLQALSQPNSTTPALDTWLDAPNWPATGLAPGTWYIRIQVQDPSGLLSAFSPPRTVQVLPLVTDGFGNPVGTDSGLGLEHP